MTACGDLHPVDHHGEQIVLTCSIDPGHTGPHQCYYADQLHEWANPRPL